MIHKIAFIGATGVLGKPVAKALVNSGFEVTALIRNEAKAKDLPQPLSVVLGDLRNTSDLQKLLQNKDALYLNLNLRPEEKKNDFHVETDGLQQILKVAKECNIKRIAFISSLVMRYQGMNNFNWWVFDVKARALELIRDSGIPYTIFYPSTFMENFETNYRQGNKIMLAGKSLHKMYFIAGDDFGKQVATSFKNGGNESKEYIIQGPQAFTAEEATNEYIKHHKKEKLVASKAPLGLLKFIGTFVQKVNYVSHIIEALNNYPEKFESNNTWHELGKPGITLQEFAAQKD